LANLSNLLVRYASTTTINNANILVDASNAGRGQLEISINGGRVPNNVDMRGAGRCLVTFIPNEPGTYVIDVTFNGEMVKGCPIRVDITRGVGGGETIITSTPTEMGKYRTGIMMETDTSPELCMFLVKIAICVVTIRMHLTDTRPVATHKQSKTIETVDESGKKRMVYESGVGTRVAHYGSKESKSSSSEDDRKRQKRTAEPVHIQPKTETHVTRQSSDAYYSR
jgi:hypothetical protein